MARLKQSELCALSLALTTLYADASADTLSARVLATLHGLFDCDFASFSLVDLRQGRFHASALSPLVPDWPGTEVHQRHLDSDPAAAYLRRTREPCAVKISDFVSLREYRNTSTYTEVFGRVGCDRRLGFADQQDQAPVSLITTVNRRGRDFSDGDRQLLDLLRPHLLQANALARADQRLQAERERERARLGDVFGTGLGEIDAAGRPRWLTPRAQALLAEFFPGQANPSVTGRLPEALARRLAPTWRDHPESPAPGPRRHRRLVWQFAGPDRRALKVRLVAGTHPPCWQLLLEEVAAAPTRALARASKLTTRETEVLYWVKQGKTNEEIGRIVTAATKTVGKHLENIFSKLNVETRTAAASMAAGAGGES